MDDLDKYQEKEVLREIGFHITNRCNLKCKHCLFESGVTSIVEMETNEIFNFLHALAEANNNKGRLNIYGGEPLLRNDIFDIIEKARNEGFFVEIATNCNFPKKRLERLIESRPQNITVDIDGMNASHDWLRNCEGHFNKVIQSIKLFVEAGIFTTATIVVHRKNIAELLSVLKLCNYISVSKVNIYLMTPSGRGRYLRDIVVGPTEWLDLQKVVLNWYEKEMPNYKMRWQVAYERNLTMSHKQVLLSCEHEYRGKAFVRCDGTMYSCPLLTGSTYAFGNVCRENLPDLLTQRRVNSFTNYQGCPALSFHVYADAIKADPRVKVSGFRSTCPRRAIKIQ